MDLRAASALKRVFDVGVSFPALTLLLPLLLLVALANRITMGSPVLFLQPRLGYLGKTFTIYKFRTMTNRRDEAGNRLTDAERLTRVGKFLRSTNLDEFPELFNVLKGDMSLVGPRPWLVEYRELYSPEQWRRHEAKPGITGWAAVNGRNDLAWDERIEHDLWYVKNQSLILDMKIIAMTILRILKRQGITQQGQATTEYFKGSGERNQRG